MVPNGLVATGTTRCHGMVPLLLAGSTAMPRAQGQDCPKGRSYRPRRRHPGSLCIHEIGATRSRAAAGPPGLPACAARLLWAAVPHFPTLDAAASLVYQARSSQAWPEAVARAECASRRGIATACGWWLRAAPSSKTAQDPRMQCSRTKAPAFGSAARASSARGCTAGSLERPQAKSRRATAAECEAASNCAARRVHAVELTLECISAAQTLQSHREVAAERPKPGQGARMRPGPTCMYPAPRTARRVFVMHMRTRWAAQCCPGAVSHRSTDDTCRQIILTPGLSAPAHPFRKFPRSTRAQRTARATSGALLVSAHADLRGARPAAQRPAPCFHKAARSRAGSIASASGLGGCCGSSAQPQLAHERQACKRSQSSSAQ